MFVSKLTVSQDTMDKNQLSKRQRGKLRYERLVNLDKSGEISKATTRNELAMMLGYPKGDKSGIAWVNNLVNRGFLTEHLVGRENGLMRKEFHITDKKPDYDFKNLKEATKRLRAEQQAKKILVEKKIEEEKATATLTITKGDMSISTTLNSHDIVNVLINILGK